MPKCTATSELCSEVFIYFGGWTKNLVLSGAGKNAGKNQIKKSDAFRRLNGMSKYYLSLIETKKLCKYAKTKFQICVENYVIQCGIFSILLCPWQVISQ